MNKKQLITFLTKNRKFQGIFIIYIYDVNTKNHDIIFQSVFEIYFRKRLLKNTGDKHSYN